MASGGYTPLFTSLTTGTLCGKWPDIGLWAVVLSLCDKNGIVDVTCDYLARVTGLAEDAVRECMHRFCQPDPYSRTSSNGGARLVLIEPDQRDWGWKVVNHAKYREKARLQAKDAARTASGEDSARKAQARLAAFSAVPRIPPDSPEVPLSNADANALEDIRPQKRTANNRIDPFHNQVIELYHEKLPELPRVKFWQRNRPKLLDARIRERCKEGKPANTLEYWQEFFEVVANNDFLCGRFPAATWCANLPWLLKRETFDKVIEGHYNSRQRGGAGDGQ